MSKAVKKQGQLLPDGIYIPPEKKLTWRLSFKKYKFIYFLILPALLHTLIFHYFTMPGIITAFKDYDPFLGMLKSPWAANNGLAHFKEIFELPNMWKAILNTLYLSSLTLLFCFPAPIILAILLNELKNGVFKKIVQSISYLPHFLSWISIIGIFYTVVSEYGIINDLRVLIFGDSVQRINWLSVPKLFVPNIIILSVWQGIGWGSIIYLASIAGIDSSLYEAAEIDGAGRLQQIRHITIPGIMPTTTILLIFALGGIFGSNFELVYGLQNAFIDFEVISTIVFKTGIQGRNYSSATAVGFAQGLVAFILTFSANKISKKLSGNGIW